ncbi:MAG: glycosyltransferase family 4 protein [Sedimentisphaerales bacterium]|nr:glycosyltransferase family 4 protein [Sedimentisphaerales bacterium]
MFHFAKRENCEIKVVAPLPYCPPWPWLGSRYVLSQIKKTESLGGIEVYHPRYPLIPGISMPLHGLLIFLFTLPLIIKIKKRFDFDLIDGHYIYPDGFAAVLMGRFLDRPVILSARGSDIHHFTDFKLIRPMISYALNKADHVISVSSALARYMKRLDIPDGKISIVPNGVDTSLFFPMPRAEARDRLIGSESSKVIVSVGSLTENKGYHVLIDAMPRLLQEVPGVRLFIIGKGPYRGIIADKIKVNGLDDNVILVGEIDNRDLRVWYNAADVFCLASAREGWANVIMEALACGTPVVATNVWGAPEVLTSNDVGMLVERNPDAIAKGLVWALNRDWDRDLIYNHVASRTWDVVAEEIAEIFSGVLRDKPHSQSR